MLQNLETALAGGLGQMSIVKWFPDVSTQSRIFISGNEIQGMVTYIPVGGGAGEMAVDHALYFITTDEDPRLGRNVW